MTRGKLISRFERSDSAYTRWTGFGFGGFGLPTLEAMACGTPTVLADSSSHPEVGGDAALYFPPGDCSALAARLSLLLSDDACRRDLSEKGIARARRFTWRRTAEVTVDAYRMAAAARR